MTLMSGHNYRSYRFKKKTYVNQYLGPFVNHEMNRCIQCYRCVRYYQDYAGGRDLEAFASHNHVYFGRHEDGILESEFSGNLVEVCPTGVFTDKTLKDHFTRRWDYTTSPSVCVHCGLGCNITPGERYGKLRRIRNRYNRSENGYFLCDRGRYGYEFVNGDKRPKAPLRKQLVDGVPSHVPMTREEALHELGALFANGSRAIGIGSPRASLEANFALRALVGAENFHLGMSALDCRLLSAVLEVVLSGPARQPGLGDIADHDAILILGEDLTNVAPLAALNVRQAAQNQPRAQAIKMGVAEWNEAAIRKIVDGRFGPLYIASAAETKLDTIATTVHRMTSADITRLGLAIAHAVDPDSPAPDGISDDLMRSAGEIAQALLAADKPLVISGPSCRSESVIQAAANVAWALCRKDKPAGIYFTAHECNTVGLGLFGGGTVETALDALRNGEAETVVVLENDLYRRVPAALVDEILALAKHVLVVDHQYHPTAERAEYVLPAATFAEGDGTLVNNIGCAQRLMQVFNPEGEITESWRWLRRLRAASGKGKQDEWISFDSFLHALVEQIPAFCNVLDTAPSATFRVGGLKIPRQSHRYSGRTSMNANVAVSEKGVAQDPDSPMSFSMEGFAMMTPAALMSSFWMPGWNSAQSITRFQEEVNGPLEGGDSGVRLIEPIAGSDVPYYAPDLAGDVPALCAMPLFHIFGSEELSTLSPAVAEMSPKAYIALNAEDARERGIAEGDDVQLALNGTSLTAKARTSAAIVRGVVGVPAGLRGMPFMELPAAASVTKGGTS